MRKNVRLRSEKRAEKSQEEKEIVEKSGIRRSFQLRTPFFGFACRICYNSIVCKGLK
jgi:hypothetical protein